LPEARAKLRRKQDQAAQQHEAKTRREQEVAGRTPVGVAVNSQLKGENRGQGKEQAQAEAKHQEERKSLGAS
jgi:hypothetical protein